MSEQLVSEETWVDAINRFEGKLFWDVTLGAVVIVRGVSFVRGGLNEEDIFLIINASIVEDVPESISGTLTDLPKLRDDISGYPISKVFSDARVYYDRLVSGGYSNVRLVS